MGGRDTPLNTFRIMLLFWRFFFKEPHFHDISLYRKMIPGRTGVQIYVVLQSSPKPKYTH